MPSETAILRGGTVRKDERQSAHDPDRGGFEKLKAVRHMRRPAKDDFR